MLFRTLAVLFLLSFLSGCGPTPTKFSGVLIAPISSATLSVDGDTAILDIQYSGSALKPVHDTFSVVEASMYGLKLKRADGVEVEFVHSHGKSICDFCLTVYEGPNRFPVFWNILDGFVP